MTKSLIYEPEFHLKRFFFLLSVLCLNIMTGSRRTLFSWHSVKMRATISELEPQRRLLLLPVIKTADVLEPPPRKIPHSLWTRRQETADKTRWGWCSLRESNECVWALVCAAVHHNKVNITAHFMSDCSLSVYEKTKKEVSSIEIFISELS